MPIQDLRKPLEVQTVLSGAAAILATLSLSASTVGAQTWTTRDPVLERIWRTGISESRIERIAQPLIDSIGPRRTGGPAHSAAHRWAVQLLKSWSISARIESFGVDSTGFGWERGITHVDLIKPRLRSLDGAPFGGSPGTNGPIDAPVVVYPEYTSYEQLQEWLRTVRGKFVAFNVPPPTCRPDSHYEKFGRPGALDRLNALRDQAVTEQRRRAPLTGFTYRQLEEAGPAGVLQSLGSGPYGVGNYETSVPYIGLSCEDYGLVYRLASNGQGPVLRLDSRARKLGPMEVLNTIAVIPGKDLRGEFVMLSAHMDSYEGGAGATDNASGVAVMLEAMRLLREAYPQPKRTIMLALWGSEEQGLEGSKRFVSRYPEIVSNLQVLLNQDHGTGRIVEISDQGIAGLATRLSSWITRLPHELSRELKLTTPGAPSGSDDYHFAMAGAPAVDLTPIPWDYSPLTHHTTLDTFDKLVFEDLRTNAVLVAMLAYLAAEDPLRVPHQSRSDARTAGPATISAVADVLSGNSLQDDRHGPFINDAAVPPALVRVFGDHFRICTISGACAPAGFRQQRPESARVMSLDLSGNLPETGATNRGTVHSDLTLLRAYWADRERYANARAIPVGTSVSAERVDLRFPIAGKEHLLQFGPSSDVPAGPGTTAGTITRTSETRWSLRSGPNSIGRLWDLSDPLAPRDRGLYRFTYDLLFRVGPTF